MKRKLIWGAIGAVALVLIIKFFPKIKDKVMGFVEKK